MGGKVQKQGGVTIKKNEIVPSAATWMDLETIKLNAVSQTEKNMISFICRILKK